MAHQLARAAISQGGRVLSVMEKVKLVCWFEETNSFAQVARRYRAEFGMEPPQMDQVKKLHQRFLKTGSILNNCHSSTLTATPVATATTTTMASFPGLDNEVNLMEQQQTQQMSVVSDAFLDAEEQLRMARM